LPRTSCEQRRRASLDAGGTADLLKPDAGGGLLERFIERFLEAFDRDADVAEGLARIGEPDPAGALAELRKAAATSGLDASRRVWIAGLLRSARPGFGARALRELVEARMREGLPPLALEDAPWLPILLGSSNFLARLLVRSPALGDELLGAPPAPPELHPAADFGAIREAKYRGLLRIAARDLAGRAFAESLRELSDLADGCLAAALVCAGEITGVEPPALLALGKLGGRELNFSSDVDLLFLYDSVDDGDGARGAGVARLVRILKAGLEKAAVDGFAYRVDLDLRPEGAQGPLANGVEAALGYYESFGHDWERQMLIRLRHVAGSPAVARRFADGVRPFVYRRLIDPAAPRAVRAMKLRIEEERRIAGRDLEFELKEGPGGIRDVEFLVQALQLFHGGRHPAIRTGNVLDALAALAAAGLFDEADSASLAESYTWLRRAEHALQMIEERQTQRFPREPEAQLGLARRMGYEEPEAERARERLLEDWARARATVRRHFDALVLGGGS
jgi:glutamate-ammonia-ligase adenylyltransferase